MTLLFLDVDGVLIPLRARPSAGVAPARGNPLLDRLDPGDGPRLLALGADALVWSTSWLGEANEAVGPRLGLPPLPFVDWPDEDDEPPRGVHWKTAGVVAWAAGRPFAWLDDEVTDADRRWVAAHHPAPALLHRVDPAAGLTPADLAAVGAWIGAAGQA